MSIHYINDVKTFDTLFLYDCSVNFKTRNINFITYKMSCQKAMFSC